MPNGCWIDSSVVVVAAKLQSVIYGNYFVGEQFARSHRSNGGRALNRHA